VAHGVQYKFSEQYFLGIWSMMINQTVFVLTNLRLIMIQSDTKGRPKHTYWMIFYNQITKFKAGWTGQIAIDLLDGTKLRFTGFRGLDRKNMPVIFERAVETYKELGFEPQSTQSRETICCRCLEIVPKNQYECPKCGQKYWRPIQLALRSLIFPSWGDLLMRHYTLAAVELIGYVISWFIVIALVQHAGDLGAAVFFSAFILIFEHCIDAALTYFIAKKGLVPKKPLPG
jgi:hypothetical protein